MGLFVFTGLTDKVPPARIIGLEVVGCADGRAVVGVGVGRADGERVGVAVVGLPDKSDLACKETCILHNATLCQI